MSIALSKISLTENPLEQLIRVKICSLFHIEVSFADKIFYQSATFCILLVLWQK